MIKVWDPLVRLFHWSLVASFAIAWVSAEGWDVLHEWSGYVAGALIGLRIVWGLIGTRYARFTQFVKSPGTVITYLKQMASGTETRYLGHNPAGGAMIIALLITLAATVWSGWLLTLPQYAKDSLVKDGHGVLTSLLMGLVILHVGGVIVAGWRHRENLAKSMINGKKRSPDPDDIA